MVNKLILYNYKLKGYIELFTFHELYNVNNSYLLGII